MTEWWEKFNLRLNPLVLRKPFKTAVQFDNLLVETSIFSTFDNLLKDPNKLLNRIMLLCGEYGSGKTVLFNYIEFSLLKHSTRISHAYILLGGPYRNNFELKEDFISKLYYKITRDVNPAVGELHLIECLRKKKVEKGITGIVIILDELHRIPDHQIVFDFFKNLQSIFHQIQEHLDCSIIIVGRNEWIDRFYTVSDYSGIVYDDETMPDLIVDEALALIQNRLVFYSKTKDFAKKNRNRVSSKAMEKIFQILNHRTPREILIEVNKRFSDLNPGKEKLNQYEIINPVHKWQLGNIRRLIKSKQYVKLNNNLLDIKNNLTLDQFQSATKILSEFYYRNTIDEKEWVDLRKDLSISDDCFLKITSVLKVKEVISLKKDTTMLKQQHGADYFTKSYYTLRKDISSFFENIQERYTLLPEDYLSIIYLEDIKEYATRSVGTDDKRRDPIAVTLESILFSLKDFGRLKIARNHIGKALEHHNQTGKYISSIKSQIKPLDVLDSMRSAIMEILTTIEMYRRNSADISINEKELLENAIIWTCDEYGEWYPKAESIRVEASTLDKTTVNELIGYYMQVVNDLTSCFLKDLKQDPILTIPLADLSRQERRIFYIVRDHVAKNELEEGVSKLRNFYEKFLRKFIREELEQHGGQNWAVLIPDDILGKCRTREKNEKRDSYYQITGRNLLDYSDFRDLKDVILKNWDKFSGFFLKSGRFSTEKENNRMKAIVAQELEDFNKLRSREAHSRSIDSDFRNLINKSIRASLEQIQRINFEREKRYRGFNLIFERDKINVEQRASNYAFVKAGSIEGYISNEIWEEFKNNSEIKKILSQNRPVTFAELRTIKLQKIKEWKDILLCFAITIKKGYSCEERNNAFIFSKT